MSTAPPGWYPQSNGSLRYWDGHAWTEHTAPDPRQETPAQQAARPYRTPLTAPEARPTSATSGWNPPHAHSTTASHHFEGTPQHVTRPRGVPPTGVTDPGAPTGRPWWRRNLVLLLGLLILAVSLSIGAITSWLGPGLDPDPTPVGTPTQDPTPESTEAVKVDALDADRQDAIDRAELYLEIIPFSESGLVSQLEFEGFTTEVAQYAVDHIDPDWDEQAVLKAWDYLEYLALSESTLLEFLDIAGFTEEQARYALDNIDVDWFEQAALAAEEHVDYGIDSRPELLRLLEFDGFTPEQAQYGADATEL